MTSSDHASDDVAPEGGPGCDVGVGVGMGVSVGVSVGVGLTEHILTCICINFFRYMGMRALYYVYYKYCMRNCSRSCRRMSPTLQIFVMYKCAFGFISGACPCEVDVSVHVCGCTRVVGQKGGVNVCMRVRLRAGVLLRENTERTPRQK